MLRVYIATSWKMQSDALAIASKLREVGFEVDCFCDPSSGRYVFHWTEFVEKEEDLQKYDAKDFIDDLRTDKAFREDKKWLDWADICLLVLPSGKSAHLEAGYAKGRSKKLYIYGDFKKGEFDVMYGFADKLFRWDEMDELINEFIEQAIEIDHKQRKADNNQ